MLQHSLTFLEHGVSQVTLWPNVSCTLDVTDLVNIGLGSNGNRAHKLQQ